MNGSVGAGAEEALAFVKKLQGMLSCEVVTWDERLTTMAANRALRESGQKMRDSRGVVDQVAAQMILQGYLDGLQAGRAREAAADISERD
jgi:putative Holliday junction resolvase